jgi:hypothetical protein
LLKYQVDSPQTISKQQISFIRDGFIRFQNNRIMIS